MEVALMSRPTKFTAGLPEDFSGKNNNATCWLLAMKAYFIINAGIYMEDATTILIFLNKLSKGRGATFTKGWYMKLANVAIPESKKTFKNYAKPSSKPSSQRISKTEHARLSTPSAWTNSMETSTNTPLLSNWPKHAAE